MLEILTAVVPGVCILGLLYGAYVAIARRRERVPVRENEGFDPITTHTWFAPRIK